MTINILTYGTFDYLHIGHINILKRSKALGDNLYVGVSTDQFNATKNKVTFSSFEHRMEIVQSIKYVHQVFPEQSWDQKIEDIKKYKIDKFVMGDDWQGKFDDLKEFCEVIYLPRTKDISSTQIKQSLSK